MVDPGPAEFATPTLMRAARGAYAQAIRAQLHAIGVDDLPRNGAFLLAGIDSTGGPRQDLPADLGVTRQAVSQAIDTLVNRGYLDRSPDPADRRRIVLKLTERGQQVVDAVLRGVATVDVQLTERVPADQIDAMRTALLALAEIKSASIASGAGRLRPARQLRQFSPIFPVRDLAAALAHYCALGFATVAYDGGSYYGFADRDGIGLHLAADPGHDPARRAASTYLYVRDADALYEEWSRPGIGGHTHPVGPTPYGLREGSHTDPDGNLIRFGSPVADRPGGG
jgi:DNA-binding MarR family transcriptional regulator/catechol 2,3-dioxygenase-like lactoylglutathione lyase family enzyme